MKPTLWIYTSYLTTPIACSSIDKLAGILSQIPHNSGTIEVVEGRSRYRMSTKVSNVLANDLITKGVCVLSICGEGVPIESPDDLIDMFRKVSTERLYVDGVTLRSTATTIETAYRRGAA